MAGPCVTILGVVDITVYRIGIGGRVLRWAWIFPMES